MQSGNSAVTSSGPSGAASVVAPKKTMRGCWRRKSEVVDVIRHARISQVLCFDDG